VEDAQDKWWRSGSMWAALAVLVAFAALLVSAIDACTTRQATQDELDLIRQQLSGDAEDRELFRTRSQLQFVRRFFRYPTMKALRSCLQTSVSDSSFTTTATLWRWEERSVSFPGVPCLKTPKTTRPFATPRAAARVPLRRTLVMALRQPCRPFLLASR
jgi:hypothetical protein